MSGEIDTGGPIQGQMLRHSARREVAIYLRGGALWVADFVDGDGQIVDAATWIRVQLRIGIDVAGAAANGSRIRASGFARALRADRKAPPLDHTPAYS